LIFPINLYIVLLGQYCYYFYFFEGIHHLLFSLKFLFLSTLGLPLNHGLICLYLAQIILTSIT
jgi:hypothetical protein